MLPYQTGFFDYSLPEDLHTEYKTCNEGKIPNDLWKTISAFANADGGKVSLGVTPDNKPIGLTTEQLDRVQRDLLSLCQNSFNYPIVPQIQLVGDVVTAYISPAPSQVRPIYSKSRGASKGAYIRIGSSNVEITDEIRNQFAMAARGGAELIEFSGLHYENCFDMVVVNEYLSAISQSRGNIYQDLSTTDILIKLRAINHSGNPTLFGLLAFSKNNILQENTAPTVNIAITQYATDSKVNISDPNETFIDDREFNGNVISQFKSTANHLRSKLPIRGLIDPQGLRQEYLSIPEIAIREALANAIAHRDYSTYSSRIQIDIYADRIEIINPGRSLVPIERIDETPSVSRNPTLMSFLKDFHITEQRARGIKTIRDSLNSAGLKEPLFENLPSSFRITIYNSTFMDSEDHLWLQQFKKHNLNERQLTALTYLKNSHNSITNHTYREINNMNSVGDDRRARHELERLVKFGLIFPQGETRHRRYNLNTNNL
mgnify:FL=1